MSIAQIFQFENRGKRPWMKLWIMWIVWITGQVKKEKKGICRENAHFMRKGENPLYSCRKSGFAQRNPQPVTKSAVDKAVDNVDNYCCRKFSPIFTTSPAPIVINRSPLVQLCIKKFSISEKFLK